MSQKNCSHEDLTVNARGVKLGRVVNDEEAGLCIEISGFCTQCGMKLLMPDCVTEVNMEEPFVSEDRLEINIPVVVSAIPEIDKKRLN